MTKDPSELSLEEHLETVRRFPVVGSDGLACRSVDYLFKTKGVLPYGYDRESGRLIVAVDRESYSAMGLNDMLMQVTEFPMIITPEMRRRGASENNVELLYLPRNRIQELLPYVSNPEKVMEYFENKTRIINNEQGLYDENSEANRIIDSIIKYAIRRGASDIHFEAEGSKFRVRIRVDGELQEYPGKIPDQKYNAVISSIKIRSNLDIAERRKPQDGRIAVNPAILKEGGISANYDLRVSVTPTVTDFENAVLRIAERGAFKSLDQLGFSSDVYSKVRELCQEPYGLILVTGPTGSGKTTTLYGMVNELNTTDRKIITIEDPVEIRMNGVQQMQIKEAIGLNFVEYMRTVLRQDPDTILIGEIRDDETARAAIEASKTGHLVLSTLHTNTSISTLLRLMGMGIAHADIASNIQGVLSQQLARVFSPNVREEIMRGSMPENVYQIDGGTELNRIIGQKCFEPNKLFFYDSRSDQAYSGRTALTELWAINDEARDMISSGIRQSEKYLPVALKGGMKPMLISGLEKVITGQTSLENIVKTVGIKTFKTNSDLIKEMFK